MKKTILIGAMLAFVVPIGFVVATNFSSTSVNGEAATIPTGKLLYFYAPS